jgi:hypothetical protein|tara:strand:+ start:242 stop:505 length:264 start_codon:yes stop_codon:yes gene_type:complete
MYPKSKKQKLNHKVYTLLMEWLASLLPENSNLTEEQIIDMLPKEKYFSSMGQRYLNAYTHKWVRQRLKKQMRIKPLDEITMSDLENA